ncbi:MAG: glycosyltransferase family 2 protein [Nitrososphaeria archaeon]
MKIDVVVCTKNSAQTVKHVLERILKYVPLNRLIIIDGLSKDGTIDIVKKFGAEIYSDQGKGLGYARNMALNLVETKIFAFIDSDVLIPGNWFTLIKHLKHEKVAAANGFTAFGLNHPILKALSKYQLKNRRYKPLNFSNTLLKIEPVLKVGGIRKNLPSHEDTELHSRLIKHGFTWVVDKHVIAYHPRTLKEHMAHIKWWGKGDRAVGRSQLTYLYSIIRSLGSGLNLALQAHPALIICFPLLQLNRYLGYLEEAKEEKIRCPQKNI